MARKKEDSGKKVSVSEGLEFDTTENNEIIETINSKHSGIDNNPTLTVPTNETSRLYSKYYKPHPKLGNKGGVLGKPPVKEQERKRSVSIQLSDSQKERFNQAAAKDSRKWPDFVIRAIEEYIENHNL